MSGPVGGGKSTLLRQAFDSYNALGHTTAWLSVDPEMSLWTDMFCYLLEAFCRVGVITQAEQANMGDLILSGENDIQDSFRELRTCMIERKKRVAVFIDNLDLVTSDTLMKEVNRVLDEVPDGLQIIVASRNADSVQANQREMNGELLYISQQELRFRSSEARIFLENALKTELEDRTLSRLVEFSEGWPRSLFRVVNMINSDPYVVSRYSEKTILSIACEDIFETLFRELPEDLQSFLLRSSQLRHFSFEIYEYIFECVDARLLIKRLIQNNVFIVETTARGQWFRYTLLFQNYLDQKWCETGKNLERSLQMAASWCLSKGYDNEAVDYLLLAKQYEEALLQIVELSKSTLRTSGDTTTVVEWVEKLPLEFQHRYASLLLDYGLALSTTRRGEMAKPLVPHIDHLHQSGSLLALPGSSPQNDLPTKTVMIAACASLDENHSAQKLVNELLPDASFQNSFSAGFVLCCSAYCRAMFLDFETALQHAEQAYIHSFTAKSPYVRVSSKCFAASIYLKMGRLKCATQALDEVEDYSGQNFPERHFVNLQLQLLRAEISFWNGDFDTSDRLLVQSWEYLDKYGYPESMINAVRTRVWLANIQGPAGAVKKIASLSKELAIGVRMPLSITAEEIAIHALNGNHGETGLYANSSKLLDTSWSSLTRESGPILELVQQRALAEYHISQKKYLPAIRVLSLLSANPVFSQLKLDHIRINIILAYALARSGDLAGAVKAFSMSLKLAHPDSIVAPFIMYQTYVEHIIRQFKDIPEGKIGGASTKEYKWFWSVFEQIDDEMASASDVIFSDFQLTSREIEILHLVKEGFSNSQLAEELNLKVATVKWHLHNVLQKMNVQNRTRAIAVATQFGILS